ncbi:ABC transporter permease [Puia sp.]|jgi:predicted permease|uniref:ABC transporter permease n=1 Tax=Puia sp. TaxID=2045100 RepID=UPI002F3F29BD
MPLNNLRTALRNAWKNRSINAINITGLAAGMTAAILIFLWVTNELTYDGYHPNADRIHRVTAYIGTAKWTWETAPLPLVAAVRTSLPEVEAVTCYESAYNLNFRIGEDWLTEKKAAYVDSAWFSIFHYDFLAGNPRNFFSTPHSLILSKTKAKKYFGDRDPIGQTLRIDTIDYRVAGIIKDIPANSSFQFDVIMPLEALLEQPGRRENELTWGNFNYQVYLRLRPGADPRKAAAAIDGLLHRSVSKGEDESTTLSLIPLKSIHFETGLTSTHDVIHANRSTVTIFTVLGVFLLIIACINYVNLTTARAGLRAKEVGIRKIIGAGTKTLFLQFITESLLISLLSLLITIGLVSLALPAFRDLTDKSFPSPFASPLTWEIIGLTLLAATALNGVYPALLLSGFKPLNVLRGAAILKFKDVFLRKGLVVLQFTFSIILIIGTLIIQRQLSYIQHTDPGYNRSQVISVNMPFLRQKGKDRPNLTEAIKQELLAQTGVSGVTIANYSPVSIQSSNSGSANWDGRDTSFRPTVYQLSTDEDYQKVMQLQMAQGRWFDPRSPMDAHNFIINETAAATFNMHKPILGQRFSFQGDTGVIIGIVKDFHFASLHDKIQPLAVLNRNTWRTSFFIRTEPGKQARVLAAAQAIVKRYDQSRPFEYSFLDEQFDGLYKADQKVSTLILIFSVVAILISCLGLFGLAAFTAQQRIKEIGIRKVLGATVPNIIALLSRDFVRLVLISLLIATPIAGLTMHKWLEDFAYHIPLSAGYFIAGGLLALLVAVLTVSTQSVRAAISNPAQSLRSE